MKILLLIAVLAISGCGSHHSHNRSNANDAANRRAQYGNARQGNQRQVIQRQQNQRPNDQQTQEDWDDWWNRMWQRNGN